MTDEALRLAIRCMAARLALVDPAGPVPVVIAQVRTETLWCAEVEWRTRFDGRPSPPRLVLEAYGPTERAALRNLHTRCRSLLRARAKADAAALRRWRR